METRRLGRTGHRSSVVTFGGAAIGRVDQATADRAIEAALAAGVNHVDVAPTYGDAELRLQPWIARSRDRIFLGGKTRERDREAAKAQLHRSLERLGTDRLDLYQLHSVGKLADLDACTAAGGALETLVEARAEGLVRWLGITGHTHDAPATHLEALRRFDFDTVMFPINFVLWADPAYRRDAEALLEACRARDVGVHVIKAVAKDPWGDRPEDAQHLVRAVHRPGGHRCGRRVRPLPPRDDAVQRRGRGRAAGRARRRRPGPAAGPGRRGRAARERGPVSHAVRRLLGVTGRATAEGTAAYASRHGAALGPSAFTALGTSGLTVSRLGFGGYRVDDETPEHAAALASALAGGVNLIDTSTNYTDGGSERCIGRVLAEASAGGGSRGRRSWSSPRSATCRGATSGWPASARRPGGRSPRW